MNHKHLFLTSTLLLLIEWGFQAPQNDRIISQECTALNFDDREIGWNSKIPMASMVSFCAPYGYMMGYFGSSNTIWRTYTWENSPHYAFKFQYFMVRLDIWDWVADWVMISYDGVLEKKLTYYYFQSNGNICGNPSYWNYLDGYAAFTDVKPHTKNTLTIEFQDDLQNVLYQSYGIRDIYLKLLMCDTTCQSCSGPLKTDCLSCYNLAGMISGSCSCKYPFFTHEFSNPPDACTSAPCIVCELCASSCKTCFGSNKDQCLSCNFPDALVGSKCEPPIYYEIVASEFFGNQWDITQTDSWTINVPIAISSRTSLCNNFFLFGGQGIFGSGVALTRKFNNLTPHYAGRISLVLLKIDTWDSGETIFMKIDGNFIKNDDVSGDRDNLYIKNQCGNSDNDDVFIFSEVFSHSSSSLTFEISSAQNGPTENYWGFHRYELIIYKCLPSCTKCADNTRCTDCPQGSIFFYGRCNCPAGKFLDINDNCNSQTQICMECVDSCPNQIREDKKNWICGCEKSNKYRDPVDLVCKKCNFLCSTCFGGGFFDCIECAIGYYLLNNKCYNVCPFPYEPHQSKQICVCGKKNYVSEMGNCIPCSSNCLECEKESDRCTTCGSSLILYNNTCVDSCPIRTVLIKTENICRNCNKNCFICNSNNICSECNEEIWTELCAVINEIKECNKCNSGYFLRNATFCEEIIKVSPELTKLENYLQLDFTIDSQLFVENINRESEKLLFFKLNNTQVQPSQLKTQPFKERYLHIFAKFSSNIYKDTILSMSILKQPWMETNSNRVLSKFKFQITFEEDNLLCSNDEFYDNTKHSCSKKLIVTPKLSITKNAREINIYFDKPFTDLFNRLAELMTATIEGLNPDQYSYILEKKKNLEWKLIFDFKVETTNTPLLIWKLNLPIFIKEHKYKKLSTTNLNITMKSYFDIENSEELKIAQASTTSNSLARLGLSVLTISNVAKPKSSFSFRNRCIVDIIQFLRFCNINHPPNALAVFEAESFSIAGIPGVTFDLVENDLDTEKKFKSVTELNETNINQTEISPFGQSNEQDNETKFKNKLNLPTNKGYIEVFPKGMKKDKISFKSGKEKEKPHRTSKYINWKNINTIEEKDEENLDNSFQLNENASENEIRSDTSGKKIEEDASGKEIGNDAFVSDLIDNTKASLQILPEIPITVEKIENNSGEIPTENNEKEASPTRKSKFKNLSDDINDLHKRMTQLNIPLTFVNMDDLPNQRNIKYEKHIIDKGQRILFKSKNLRKKGFSLKSEASRKSIFNKSSSKKDIPRTSFSKKIYNETDKSQKEISLERYNVLFENYRLDSKWALFSVPLDFLKNISITASIVLIQDQPLQQLIFIFLADLVSLLFIIIIRPYNNLRLNILGILNELTLTIITCFCLFICYKETTGGITTETLIASGWWIYYTDSTMKYLLLTDFFLELAYKFFVGIDNLLKIFQPRPI